jgi:hypothetical protein
LQSRTSTEHQRDTTLTPFRLSPDSIPRGAHIINWRSRTSIEHQRGRAHSLILCLAGPESRRSSCHRFQTNNIHGAPTRYSTVSPKLPHMICVPTQFMPSKTNRKYSLGANGRHHTFVQCSLPGPDFPSSLCRQLQIEKFTEHQRGVLQIR